MKIDPNLHYKIGNGGLIEGKLIFCHPYSSKIKRPWVARCYIEGGESVIKRDFLDGYKEHYDDNHYVIEFDLAPFEIYQIGNIYLGKNTEAYKGYIAVSNDEFVEIEFESVLVFMGLYKGKKKREKRPPLKSAYAPDDIDF